MSQNVAKRRVTQSDSKAGPAQGKIY